MVVHTISKIAEFVVSNFDFKKPEKLVFTVSNMSFHQKSKIADFKKSTCEFHDFKNTYDYSDL